MLGTSVPHRTPSRHGLRAHHSGAGGIVQRPIRTSYSETDLRANTRPTTATTGTYSMRPKAAARFFQVFETTPIFGVEAEHSRYRVEYNELEKSWHKVLFPSLSPSSEKDIMMVRVACTHNDPCSSHGTKLCTCSLKNG